MREERGRIPGGVIDGDLCLRGQMTGDGRVASGAHLDLYGQVGGSLTIDSSATANVYGMVCGDLVNRGKVTVAGTITGTLRDESGEARVEPGAVVGGRA